jgi:phosphohistidine phosphatase
MDLILWRHAEAQELPAALSLSRNADLQRSLTRRGHRQAKASAEWLRGHLPADARIVCSPALRTQETVAALSDDSEVLAALAPGNSAAAALEAIKWPHGDGTTVLVGHQPTLGRIASLLLAGEELGWSVR